MSTHTGTGVNTAKGGFQSWSSYWRQQSKVIFFAVDSSDILNKVTDGKLYNQKNGTTDYLTVTGTGLNARYQTPNNATYKNADTDYVFWKTDASESTCDGNRLIAYDLAHTLVYYSDTAPYVIKGIVILSSNLSSEEIDRASRDFHLSMFWSGVLNDYGYLKENRVGYQPWTAESVDDADFTAYNARRATPLAGAQKTAMNALVVAAKANGWWTPFGCIRILHNDNEADSLLNLKSSSFTATKVSTPVFTAYSGFVSNGTAKALNNNYIPSSAGDMTQNDASFIEYWSDFNAAESNRFSGVQDGTYWLHIGNSATTTKSGRINEGSGSSTSGAGATSGLWGIIRSGATTKMYLVNAVKIDDTDASTGLPTKSIYSAGFNDNGSVNYSNSTRTTRAVLIGKAISQSVFNSIQTDLETFFAAFTA